MLSNRSVRMFVFLWGFQGLEWVTHVERRRISNDVVIRRYMEGGEMTVVTQLVMRSSGVVGAGAPISAHRLVRRCDVIGRQPDRGSPVGIDVELGARDGG